VSGIGVESPPARGSTLPSGAQHVIEHGRHRAVIVEVGGGIRTLVLDAIDVLDGFAEDERASSGRGQVLQPWPNRLRDGRYTFDGETYQVALNEPVHGNAIHGLVRWAGWTAAEHEPDRIVMVHVLHPQPGYPTTLGIRIEYVLGDRGLTVKTTATNLGAEACPFGAGAHPWLTVGTPTVDHATLRLPAARAIWCDERGIPIRTGPVDGTELDFRVARPIGTVAIDNGFADLERDVDGVARVRLDGPERGYDVWLDRSFGYVMVSTGDVLPDVARRAIAIEPMTCPPNAFQTGEAVIRLEPGETFTGTWGIAPH